MASRSTDGMGSSSSLSTTFMPSSAGKLKSALGTDMSARSINDAFILWCLKSSSSLASMYELTTKPNICKTIHEVVR